MRAQGYEWDHADEVGVRYLLYQKMRKRQHNPEYDSAQMRLAYVPIDPNEFLQVQGYPVEWGIEVYEFAPPGAESAPDPESAATFERFATETDPRLARGHRREWLVRGEVAGELRLWEYRDTFLQPGWVDGGRGTPAGFAWGHHRALGVRFLVERSMQYRLPRVEKDSAHLCGTFMPAQALWLPVKGAEHPIAWTLLLYAFPPAGEGVSPVDAAARFADWVAHPAGGATVEIVGSGEEQRGSAGPYRLWEYVTRARSRSGGAGAAYHHVAGVHERDGRELALVGRIPTGSGDVDARVRGKLLRMVASLEPFEPGPREGLGSGRYYVAAARALAGREVALVFEIPVEAAQPPDRELLARARRITRSLTPKER